MPSLTRWFVKSALVYFVAALFMGVAISFGPAPGSPLVPALRPVYFHLLMVGWVSQLIFGVVYWMFPKYSIKRPRGGEKLGWATYWLLNAGLLLRAFGEPWMALQPGRFAAWALVASSLLQLGAGWAFVANTWARVKEH